MFDRKRKTLNVILLLILTRILLNVPAIVGANLFPLADGIPWGFQDLDPRHLPGIRARWDSGYYLSIADSGYSLHGPEVAFFPAYPFLMRLFAFFDHSFIVWSGFLISNLAYALANDTG